MILRNSIVPAFVMSVLSMMQVQDTPRRAEVGDPTPMPISSTSLPKYMCVRPARPASWQKVRRPAGDWLPTHNVNNWTYVNMPGNDFYRHKKNSNRTMGVVCTGFGFHHGQMVRDLTGNEDWCANYQAAQTRSVVNPACNGWGEHSPDQSTCIPNDPPEKIRHPAGDWKWYHNTNKWHYEKKAGADVYRHNSNSDVVATQCSGSDFFGEFEYGELKIDYVGQQDWCVKVRREMPSSCPANHSHVKM